MLKVCRAFFPYSYILLQNMHFFIMAYPIKFFLKTQQLSQSVKQVAVLKLTLPSTLLHLTICNELVNLFPHFNFTVVPKLRILMICVAMPDKSTMPEWKSEELIQPVVFTLKSMLSFSYITCLPHIMQYYVIVLLLEF